MIHHSERYAPSRPEYNKIYKLNLPNRRPAESACGHDACARDVFVCNALVRNTLVRSTFVRNSLGALHACFHSERTHRYPERYAPSRPEYNKIYELHLPNRRPTESACGHDAFVRNAFARDGSVALHAPPILSSEPKVLGGGISLFLFQVKVLGSAMSLPFPYGPCDP